MAVTRSKLRRRPRLGLDGKVVLALASVVLIAMAGSGQVRAEASQIRFVDQPGGLLYIPMHVVISQKLIEKRAKEAGLGDVKVSGTTMSGGAAMNDALLSGNADFLIAGVAPLLKLWDKTKGRSNEVRAMMAVASMPLQYITNDPRVKTAKDFVGITDHRIGVPAVKTSMQAVILEMVAEQLTGDPFKLNALTVSMPHPQSFTAVIGGKSPIRTHGGASEPFSSRLLKAKDKDIRLIFSSYDIVGPHTLVLLYCTRKWKEDNPKLFKIVYDAYMEAFAWANADFKRAAQFEKEYSQLTLEVDEIQAIISDRNRMFYDPVPRSTMKFADFLHRTKSIDNKPASWKDYMWETAHEFAGN